MSKHFYLLRGISTYFSEFPLIFEAFPFTFLGIPTYFLGISAYFLIPNPVYTADLIYNRAKFIKTLTPVQMPAIPLYPYKLAGSK